MTFPASDPIAIYFVGLPLDSSSAHRGERLQASSERSVAHSKSEIPRSRKGSLQPTRRQRATDAPDQSPSSEAVTGWPIQVTVWECRNTEP